MTIKKMQGLNAGQYSEIKDAAKKELKGFVTIRQHKQRYAYGAIDIRPTKKNGAWTEEQFSKVKAFILSHNLTMSMSEILFGEHGLYIHRHQGVNYLFKVA